MARFIRPMELEDVPQASDIEREAFPPPWPATNFRHALMFNSSTTYLVACDELTENDRSVLEHAPVNCCVQSSGSGFGWLRSGLTRLFKGDTAVVAPRQLILGFASVWFVLDEAHISNIAVLESRRRQGIGEQLLISIIKIAIERNACYINLEVRASNKIAQALYTKYDFDEVGTRYGYYSDNKEDAVLMTANNIYSSSFQDNLQRLMNVYTRRWGIIV